MVWKLTIALVTIVGVGGALYLSGISRAHVMEALHYVERATISPETPAQPIAVPVKIKSEGPWDGFVTVSTDEQEAIGLQMTTVEAQTQPITLELTGRTAYDPDTLTKIRPRFDTLVEYVYASLGQRVKVGDKLVELHSTDLAAAKSDFQSKFVQWQHDLNLYNLRQELVKSGAISEQLWVDTQNDEKKSRLDYQLARDKLIVLKVPEQEIDPLLANLGSVKSTTGRNPGKVEDKGRPFGKIEDKAKMTLLSPTDGIVIEREVVPQNFYETSSVLMVIAPLDHLWVWVNVYEVDQDKVKEGQTMEIQFPFLEKRIQGTVKYIASEVSKDTRAVRVRAEIPNPGTKLKSDMLVKAMLDIPPVKGQTVIPRLSMVSTNGSEYVFVRKPRATDSASKKRKFDDKFERRRIQVAQENHDQVVVAHGLTAGEQIATNGSLILAQLFEDTMMVDTGAPVK